MLNFTVKLLFAINIAVLVPRIEATLKLSFDVNIHRVQESGSECILKLAHRYFPPASIISIVSSGVKRSASLRVAISSDQLVLQKIMLENGWTLMTKTALGNHNQDRMDTNLKNRLQDNLKFTEKVHAYIMVARTNQDLSLILSFLKNTSSWNPHANVILYMDTGITMAQRDPLLTGFASLAWKYFVVNFIIVVLIRETNNQQIITWFPFDEGNCGKQEIRLHLLGVCEKNELIPNNTNYFPEKVPSNLNKCVIRVGTFAWPPYILKPTKYANEQCTEIVYSFENGIEIEIIKTIAKHFNFTIEFKSFDEPENWGTTKHNGTGLIGMLMRQEIDIAIATFTPTSGNHELFDFTVQYTQDKTTWLVPAPDLIPPWQSLVAIFQPRAWIASGLVYVIVSVVTYLLGISSNENLEHRKFRHLYGTFLVIWRMVCGGGSPTFPKTTKIKCFLFLWLLYCMHWSAAYTTSLISMLTTPVYDQPMTRFSDIMNANMEYGMQEATTRYFQNSNFKIKKLDDVEVKKFKLCKSAAQCLGRIATKRDFAMAISREYFEFIERQYKDEFGNPLIKAFRDDIVTSPVEMLLVKGHPLLSRMDGLLLRIGQAGLIDAWAKHIKQDVSLQHTIALKVKSGTSINRTNKKVLTFYHLQGAFMALGFGLFIAFIQFLLEKLVYKC